MHFTLSTATVRLAIPAILNRLTLPTKMNWPKQLVTTTFVAFSNLTKETLGTLSARTV